MNFILAYLFFWKSVDDQYSYNALNGANEIYTVAIPKIRNRNKGFEHIAVV